MFRGLFKILAALVGLPLTLGGFFGFWYGLFLVFARHETGGGLAVAVGSLLALALGTALGRFARGDFD